jgi:hypothetical protein
MSAEAAVSWARDRVGVSENPAGSNKGPRITQWEVDSGYPWVAGAREGVPWCQCFANAAAVEGGASQIRSGYTPDFLNGRFRAQGYKPISLDDAEPGDFVYFKFPGVSGTICDHVGVLVSKTAATVTCVEGNTSLSSQNNGGAVMLRTRSRSLVPGAVSVPYPVRDAYRNLLLGMSGSDVRAFQEGINRRAGGCGRADRRVDVDGDYGSATKENGAWAAYILGIGDSTGEIKSGGISAYVQRLVIEPDERNEAQVARAPERRAQAGCGA